MTIADPKTFQSSAVKPADFDQFWEETWLETVKTPLNPRLVPDPMRSTDDIEVFDAAYDSYGGLEIHGWYMRPRNFEGKLPGMLCVPGYAGEPRFPTDLALQGYAAFSAAPRGKLRSNSVFNPGYPGLLVHNILDRDTYGYRGFYMDAVRAFDFLAGLDEVDESRMGVQGSSQGGALTLLVASLRAEETAAASAGAPYLCSMMDSASLTRSYPYEEINEALRANPGKEQVIRQTLDYYDIHNFVDRISCPIIVNIGLRDDVCPPETGYAVFNQIGTSNKKIYAYENCAHDSGSAVGHGAVINEFTDSHLAPVPVGDGS